MTMKDKRFRPTIAQYRKLQSENSELLGKYERASAGMSESQLHAARLLESMTTIKCVKSKMEDVGRARRIAVGYALFMGGTSFGLLVALIIKYVI